MTLRTPPRSPGPGARVLVVDDACGDEIARVLALRGHEAEVVPSVAAARDRLAVRLDGYHVIVLEFLLRRELGTALLPDIRACVRPPRVIVLTGIPAPYVIAAIGDDEATLRLFKPIDLDVLARAVEAATGAALARWAEIEWAMSTSADSLVAGGVAAEAPRPDSAVSPPARGRRGRRRSRGRGT